MARQSGQLFPPHDADESPIQTSADVQRRAIANRFRAAATTFRTEAEGHDYSGSTVNVLKARCGRWLIEAFRAGFVAKCNTELVELIEWHTKENEPLPKGVLAAPVRCPSNLFLGIVGGNIVYGDSAGIDPTGRLVLKNQRTGGGLLTRMIPGHLDQSVGERFAAACEYLADLIEHAEPMSPWMSKKTLARRFGLRERNIENELSKLGIAVEVRNRQSLRVPLKDLPKRN